MQWKEIETKIETIKNDVANFNMKMPDFSVFDSTKRKLEDQLGNWIIFMDFRNKVEELEKQEWMTFRGTLFKYADIVNEFSEKVKEAGGDSTSKFLNEMIRESIESLGLLRCITG